MKCALTALLLPHTLPFNILKSSRILQVFFKARKTELNAIEAECRVQVVVQGKGDRISLMPKDGWSRGEYDQACHLFIDLYHWMAQAMKMECFSLKSEKNVIPARKKFLEMSKTFSVSIQMAVDQKHWNLYGEEHDLKAALEFLRKEGIEIKRKREKDKGAGELQVSRHDEDVMDVDPPDSSEFDQSRKIYCR